MKVPFFEFRDFPEGIQQKTEQAVLQALRGKQLILGPKVEEFEERFARYLGVNFCIGVGNGYDALVLSLLASGIGKNDKVLLPANSFIAAVNAIVAVGAKPVFAEPDAATFNLCAPAVEQHLKEELKAVLPVYLYGQVTEAAALKKICHENNLLLIEDFAQTQGAAQQTRQAGSFGDVSATSFYPTKNLGAAGDGGAVCTNKAAIAEQVRLLRNYGQRTRYHNDIIGINSRLDEVQAAVLLQKLEVLTELNAERRRLAEIYLQQLAGIDDLDLPFYEDSEAHTWHLFVIKTDRRDSLQQFLAGKGVNTLIHYPVPPFLQPAYKYLGIGEHSFPVTRQLAQTCLSLPLFPGLSAPEQQYVIDQVKTFFQKK